jgi:Na+/melibiose symporter-like transporter
MLPTKFLFIWQSGFRGDDFNNKHGRHRPFLFLIGRFLKIFFSVTAWPNEPKLGGKQPMEGSVLSFLQLQAE